MNIIKRHKGLAIVGGLTLVLLIILFAIFARMIFSGKSSAYGDRLNDIAKVNKSDTEKTIKETEALTEVEDLSVRVQGKIIYMTIEFKEGTKLDKAKEIAAKTFTYYDEKVLEDYDFEYFVTENVDTSKDKEKIGFTAAGTKHPSLEKISWTKS